MTTLQDAGREDVGKRYEEASQPPSEMSPEIIFMNPLVKVPLQQLKKRDPYPLLNPMVA